MLERLGLVRNLRTQPMKTNVIPPKDPKDPDYGKSLEQLQLEYLWEKAHADLAQNLVAAARLQLYRR